MVKFMCYFTVGPHLEAKIEMTGYSDTVGSWDIRQACEKYAEKVGWVFDYSEEIKDEQKTS